ncbi:MAG: hypothetical protein DCC55_12920 [Chloroflexi bacterium]|nr:MAG: hypothetical protein DCC55_12920 [Chloroflexota bacterium]
MQPNRAAPYSSLRRTVHQALKNWHSTNEETALLSNLYLYRSLQRQEGGSPRRVTNLVLLQAIERLSATYETEARFLQARFLEREPIHRLANRLNVAESTVYVVQRQAINRLVELLHRQEEEAVMSQKARLLQRLEPPTYTELLGIEEQLERLVQLITTPAAPWLVAIEGIGGIGKTALADALLRRLIAEGRVDELAWVSARQQRFNLGGGLDPVAKPALTSDQLVAALIKQLLPELSTTTPVDQALATLRSRLQTTQHVILIDNLETLADVESLTPTLHNLANPTKFVLTSRHSLYSEPNLCHLRVAELSRPVALRLIRQEAQLSNLLELAAASDADLLPIFETVGGNPLALRLVVGQAHLYALPSILYELKMAQSGPAENLYEFIYRKAWERLDPLSRQALLAMPLGNPAGEDIEYLAEVGDLAVGELRTALSKLVTLNLVDARGGLHERRYTIHSLTRTFLQQQVARWF